MEHMESKMQDFYDAADAREAETFAMGVSEGLRQAAEVLRDAAEVAERDADGVKGVAQSAGLMFAARLLRSYGNGLTIKAEAHAETQVGIRALQAARTTRVRPPPASPAIPIGGLSLGVEGDQGASVAESASTALPKSDGGGGH